MEEKVTINPDTGEIISMDWDFIVEHYPDYDHSDEIGWEDDLECVLSGDCDDEKLARVKRQWGETTEELEAAQDELLKGIQRKAYENYKNIITKQNGKRD